jgi:hypothetical protein
MGTAKIFFCSVDYSLLATLPAPSAKTETTANIAAAFTNATIDTCEPTEVSINALSHFTSLQLNCCCISLVNLARSSVQVTEVSDGSYQLVIVSNDWNTIFSCQYALQQTMFLEVFRASFYSFSTIQLYDTWTISTNVVNRGVVLELYKIKHNKCI